MVELVRAHCTGRSLRRTAALVLILALLLSPAAGGPRPVRAAPSAQAQNLCTLVPPGYDPALVTDQADYCYVVYNLDDGTMLNLEVSRFYSPREAYLHLPCDPNACTQGQTCNSASCYAYPRGDVAPAGIGHSYQGVGYDLSSIGGLGYAWTRGCYLVVASSVWSTDRALMGLYDLNGKVDALLSTGACAGCNDPSVCQGTGTGSASSVCGPGVEAPAGTFTVSGYGCQYEEASDGVTCQAAVVNACPNANLKYTWSLDGTPAPAFNGDVFNPTGLGLCAGTHTVTVSAEDTQNNLQAMGMSWPFTSTRGSPCAAGSGVSLSVSAPNCAYLNTEDRVLCTTQVAGAPDNADIVFEWTWDGAVVQSGTGSGLDIIVTPDGRAHTVQVTARDPASGATSAPASTSVQVGGGGSLRIETGTGTTILDGRALSEGERLALMPNEFSRLLADCPLLGLMVLLDLRYDTTVKQVDENATPAMVAVAALLLDCARMKAEGPLRIASVGDPALFLPAQAAPEDLPMQLRIDMLGGPLRVNVSSDQVLLDVQTSEASVRSAGKNDFGVHFDAQTGETTVAVYGGSVEVYSMGSGIQVAALRQGEKVTVSQGQASQVTGTPPSGGTSRSTLAVCGCAAGLAVLAGLVVFAVLRSRRKRAAAPGAAAEVPRRGTPVAASGPRLIVEAGKASAGAADLSRGPVMIGRHPSSTLVVYDALVSDQHAQVSLQNGFWVLMDLGSRNGTFLNGVRVQRQALRPGDRIQVGQTVIQFQAGP